MRDGTTQMTTTQAQLPAANPLRRRRPGIGEDLDQNTNMLQLGHTLPSPHDFRSGLPHSVFRFRYAPSATSTSRLNPSLLLSTISSLELYLSTTSIMHGTSPSRLPSTTSLGPHLLVATSTPIQSRTLTSEELLIGQCTEERKEGFVGGD